MMDKAKLLKPRDAWPECEVEVDGGTVKIRALTRGEAIELRAHAGNPVVFDRKLVSLGMVQPKLSEEEAAKWQEVSLPGEMERVSNAIFELSGLTEKSAKESYKSTGP